MTGMGCCWSNGMLYKHIRSPKCTHLYWANGSQKVFQLNISRGWREALDGHSAAFALNTSLALPDWRRATSTHLTTPFSTAPARQDNLSQWQMQETLSKLCLKMWGERYGKTLKSKCQLPLACRAMFQCTIQPWRGATSFLCQKQNFKHAMCFSLSPPRKCQAFTWLTHHISTQCINVRMWCMCHSKSLFALQSKSSISLAAEAKEAEEGEPPKERRGVCLCVLGEQKGRGSHASVMVTALPCQHRWVW